MSRYPRSMKVYEDVLAKKVSIEHRLKHLHAQAGKYVDELYSYIRLSLY